MKYITPKFIEVTGIRTKKTVVINTDLIKEVQPNGDGCTIISESRSRIHELPCVESVHEIYELLVRVTMG